MRSSIFVGIGPAFLFLLPIVAGDSWDGEYRHDESLGNQEISTSCTDSLVSYTTTQTTEDSTITLTDTQTITYTVYPLSQTSTLPNYAIPSQNIPSYRNSDWITRTRKHQQTVTVTYTASSEPAWSYPPNHHWRHSLKPTWDGPEDPTWTPPAEQPSPTWEAPYDSLCTDVPDTTITITNTVMETVTSYLPQASPPSPYLDATFPYAAPTISSSSSNMQYYTSPSAAPSSIAADVNYSAQYNFHEQSAPASQPTWTGPAPEGYQSLTASVSATETASPTLDSYQPPTTDPASYDDGSNDNNDGFVGYTWTA